MLSPRRTPPSRLGKKQVIAFLRPNQVEAAQDKAARDHKTNQEIIGEAINAVYASFGIAPLIMPGHQRIVRRNSKRASVRAKGTGPECRSGKKSFGGWFDEDIVDKLNRFSSEVDLSVQSIIERGVELVTGVGPSQEEDWLSVLDRETAARAEELKNAAIEAITA